MLLYTCVWLCFWHSLWSSVVALASRDTQTAGWHRDVTKTKRLKPPQAVLLFLSNATSRFLSFLSFWARATCTGGQFQSLLYTQGYEKGILDVQNWQDWKGESLAHDKSIIFYSIRGICKHHWMDWCNICALKLIFCDGCFSCHALMCLVLIFFLCLNNKLLLFMGSLADWVNPISGLLFFL